MVNHTPPEPNLQNAREQHLALEAAHIQLRQQYDVLVMRLQQIELQQQAAPAPPAAALPPAEAADNVVQNQPQNAPADVNAVRHLKFPPFWSGNPALWFAQVEATFALYNINGDATRYRHIITQLDSRTLPAIADIITNPPAEDKYLAIKARIMSSFAETSESKMRKLLRGLDPSNEKPSLILQRIRNLADGQVGDALLRTLFLEQLHEYVRAVLAISGDIDLSTLALQADRVMEATKTTSVSAIQQPTNPQEAVAAVSARDSVMADLIASVASLAKEVKSLKSEARSRSRSSSRHRVAHASPNNDNNNLCYYHARFGDNARQCVAPGAKTLATQGN